MVFPPPSGSFRKQKKVGFGTEGEVPMTSLYFESYKPRRVSKMDAETQTSRLDEGLVLTSSTSTVSTSLDDLWKRFLKLQITACKQTQANKRGIYQRTQASCKPDEQQANPAGDEASNYKLHPKRDTRSNSTESSSSPPSDVLHEERIPEVVAFEISPGMHKQHAITHKNKPPSLQPVTLQEALLHRKPLFSMHVRERQEAVQEKRQRRFRNKPLVTRENNDEMCVERGRIWPLAERHHRPEKRQIGRKEAVEQTKRRYNQLPEVKAKQLADKRQAQSQTNRLRAALFGQKVRQRLFKSAN
jgi:hypothetical protein